VQFTRLRLSGFKSFVEPTEVAIETGLTGIVGPNGCGKSNLVEALRWVMGENSPKKMRGGAMDDVIFAGTASRSSRNLAEVVLHLDNSARKAPPAFNDSTEIEVTRRIERDQGSSYRINGQEVRARDVQLLFADLATGAHSTALVSQGRVGALINAKAIERRALLEEAAGITGLHSRRHEAELRLRAAEQNLTRVDDVVGQLEQQHQGLKRQARQANRYRNLSGHIRRAEAMVFHLRWAEAVAGVERAQAALARAEAEVAERTAESAAAQTAEAEASLALPPLRQQEAEAAARLHRLAVARDGLDAEERRAREALAQLAARLAQIAADSGREEGLARDAAEAIARLAAEKAGLEAARAEESAAETRAAADVEARLFAVGDRQETVDRLTERVAAEQAARQHLADSLAEAARRIERLKARLAEIEDERGHLAAEGDDAGAADSADNAVEEARLRAQAAREALHAAEQARLAAQGEESAARTALQEAQGQAARLAAEEAGLVKLLAVNEDDLWPPLIDAVRVAPGYEKALGAALGDDLSVATDTAAPVHWAVLAPYDDAPALPEGAAPLSRFVEAPPALARRLTQIGVVDDEAEGPRLRAALRQGQRLVSRGGALWRWDGFTARAGASTAAGTRLEQRNRLAELRRGLREAEARQAEAEAELRARRAGADSAAAVENAGRAEYHMADNALTTARDLQAAALQRAAARAARLAALAEADDGARRDLAETEARRQEDDAARAALPPENEARDLLAGLRQDLERRRQTLAEARATLDQLRREAAARVRRLDVIAVERRSWAFRAESAAEQLRQLAERRGATEAEQAAAAGLPAEIAARREALAEHIAAAETERSRAAAALAEAESLLGARGRAAKEADRVLAEAREERVRRQADAEHAAALQGDLALRIREALDCAPAETLALAEHPADEPLPGLAPVEHKLDRLRKERDNMGPVNLRAEIEAAEVEERLTTLQNERADLVAAIERLRQGIASLNREGRERLLAAFKQVDEHFQRLFVRVFGGGHAHLQLTESDDPLEAGLEIMASPPGKRLQVLSLLSGGEQALTALSLLFAVFLTNPAPICVLDEVDAPLDDANVERLCDLLDDLARNGETRFLVVTHHPITMARMDRLFGVTMAERGVSALVSVDLAAAEAIRATA
jgi:chromosome segregation protein